MTVMSLRVVDAVSVTFAGGRFVADRWVCVVVTGMVGFGVSTGSGIPSELESWRLSYWLLAGVTVGFLVPGLALCNVHPLSALGSFMYLILNNY